VVYGPSELKGHEHWLKRQNILVDVFNRHRHHQGLYRRRSAIRGHGGGRTTGQRISPLAGRLGGISQGSDGATGIGRRSSRTSEVRTLMALDRLLPVSTTPGAITGNFYMDPLKEQGTGVVDRARIKI